MPHGFVCSLPARRREPSLAPAPGRTRNVGPTQFFPPPPKRLAKYCWARMPAWLRAWQSGQPSADPLGCPPILVSSDGPGLMTEPSIVCSSFVQRFWRMRSIKLPCQRILCPRRLRRRRDARRMERISWSRSRRHQAPKSRERPPRVNRNARSISTKGGRRRRRSKKSPGWYGGRTSAFANGDAGIRAAYTNCCTNTSRYQVMFALVFAPRRKPRLLRLPTPTRAPSPLLRPWTAGIRCRIYRLRVRPAATRNTFLEMRQGVPTGPNPFAFQRSRHPPGSPSATIRLAELIFSSRDLQRALHF